MSYSSSILKHRVSIYNRNEIDSSQSWGETTGFTKVAEVWASVDWSRGLKSLREGALDAYDVVMIRMRWNHVVTRNSQIECDGRRYQIMTFNDDKQANTIQITAQEINR